MSERGLGNGARNFCEFGARKPQRLRLLSEEATPGRPEGTRKSQHETWPHSPSSDRDRRAQHTPAGHSVTTGKSAVCAAHQQSLPTRCGRLMSA